MAKWLQVGGGWFVISDSTIFWTTVVVRFFNKCPRGLVPDGHICKTQLGVCFLHFLSHLDGQYVQTKGLKAPGNYSASFWYNKIMVLLCEGPKLPNSMISGFSIPGNPHLLIL